MGRVWRSGLNLIGRVLLTCWCVALVLIISLVLGYLAYNHKYYDRIYAGVSVLGTDVGGLTPAEAYDTLQEQLGPERLPEVTVQVVQEQSHYWLGDLGGELDIHQAVLAAYALGREGVLLDDLQTRARLFWQGYSLVPAFSLDAAAAEATLRSLVLSESSTGSRERLLVSGLEAKVEPAEATRTVALDTTLSAVTEHMTAALGRSGWCQQARIRSLVQGTVSGGDVLIPSPAPVTLAFEQTAPRLGELADAEERVSTLIGSPLWLVWDDAETGTAQRWLVDQAVLSSWLTIDEAAQSGDVGGISVDRAQIAAYVAGIAAQIDRPAIDGRFAYDAEQHSLTVLSAEQTGYALDQAQAVEAIAAAAFATEREVPLTVHSLPPTVTQAELDALLPLDLLGEGTTQFVGSTAERQANIVAASQSFQGVTLPAEATFSFLDVLGPVNRATGYAESWVIFGDRTELGAGGGVCQVATTCFRAAFWSGLPIVERHPHAYRVGWYEPPLGLDASVFEPYVDLQFVNDYATPLLVQVEVDEVAQTLAFRFYGRADGRTVTMDGPETANPSTPPDPVYEADESLAPGASVQIERAHDGLEVTVVRHVTLPYGMVDDYVVFSPYAAWPARYLIGPDAEVSETTAEGDAD